MQRWAIVYEGAFRPETTGTYCLRALKQLVQSGQLESVQHVSPGELNLLKTTSCDAVLFVDDGLEYALPPLNIPVVWWAIDTHLSFERCLRKARQADLVFAAQKNGAEQLRACGIQSTEWLPLACDPEIHGRRETENRYDVAFVGNIFPGARQDVLEQIQQRFPRSFIGQMGYQQMASVYSAAKIVFNGSLRDDINMRVFEGLCSGSLLITNDLVLNGQSELLTTDEHLVTYHHLDELFHKIDHYLTHDTERERIAAAGRERVVSQHTYRQRMEAVLERLGERGQRTGNRGERKEERDHRSPLSPSPSPLKSSDYYEFDRPDVLELVPQTATRVLDLGCGGGKLGAAIKRRQDAHVTGIELNPAAVDAACQRLDEVFIGDIQRDGIEFPPESFDCVICADILEHLRDPAKVLRKIRRWLTPEGTLVTSIPNVRHHAVIRSLLAGNWTYETAGLLDEDHVRFFTRREIEKLLFRTGFDVQELRMVPGPGFAEWQQQGAPLQVQVGPLSMRVQSPAEAAEFFAYQYLTAATPAPQKMFGLTSIVLVTFNQWPHTKACLDSIRLFTDEPYELIVIDNGSTDGTVELLRSMPDVQVIENSNNRGFPAAANQGFLVAEGEQVLLLNNDTIVTTGWLRRLLTALHSETSIGLVGPVTNNISGEQKIPVTYDDLAQLDGFAWDWGEQHRGQYQQTDRLVGFCLLIKREVIDRIGLLDERFGIGNFEDDDYCRRALAVGYQCVIARDAFIHHVGSATFRGSGVDFGGLLQENLRKYEEKWNEGGERDQRSGERLGVFNTEDTKNTETREGDHSSEFLRDLRDSVFHSPSSASLENTPRGAPDRPQFLLDVDANGALLLQPNTIKLSACLIVRDNQHTIRLCLESLRPWVDEIVVVDTGSLDATPQICEELGARVLHSPWQESFSQARNVSLCFARGEWIFWMDSDDTLPEHCGRQLQQRVHGPHPENVLGYVMQVHCPGINPQDVTVVDHVKLLRNRPDLQFEFHIHEQILPAIRRAGGEVAWTDIHVVHSGSDHSEAGHLRKLQRDFKLLQKDLGGTSRSSVRPV